MCAPVALGVASFATGALGAYGQYQSGQAQAAAANANANATYRHQLVNLYRKRGDDDLNYQTSKARYNEQLQLNQDAANRAYAAEQVRLNEIYRSAAFNKQSSLVELLKRQGMFDVSGQSGKTVQRLEGSLQSQYGRNTAVQAASLKSARQSFDTRVDEIRNKLSIGNTSAYNKLGRAPGQGIDPPKPVMQTGPSGLSLATGLAGAAIDGYSTYNTLFRQQQGYDTDN